MHRFRNFILYILLALSLISCGSTRSTSHTSAIISPKPAMYVAQCLPQHGPDTLHYIETAGKMSITSSASLRHTDNISCYTQQKQHHIIRPQHACFSKASFSSPLSHHLYYNNPYHPQKNQLPQWQILGNGFFLGCLLTIIIALVSANYPILLLSAATLFVAIFLKGIDAEGRVTKFCRITATAFGILVSLIFILAGSWFGWQFLLLASLLIWRLDRNALEQDQNEENKKWKRASIRILITALLLFGSFMLCGLGAEYILWTSLVDVGLGLLFFSSLLLLVVAILIPLLTLLSAKAS